MRELVHPNLVNYEELFLERNNTLMLVMEYMQVSPGVMKYMQIAHLDMKYIRSVHKVMEYMQVSPRVRERAYHSSGC
jgi:hypothetical protein